ncbi:penicillin-binding transpeptidase domain-containing protein [Streptomyces sp. NPDC006482]|uniref:penicillin-binding transpeptidase domain-containing protein n=1 Tax=Streptomyces sp. NPDC006482 TaxID=3154306 RepID=UPI0033AB79C9
MSRYSNQSNHGHRRRRSRVKPIVGTVVTLSVLGGLGYWGYTSLVAPEGPDKDVREATARIQEFLDAWAQNKPVEAGNLTDSPKNAESLVQSVMTNLKPTKTIITAAPSEARKIDGGKVQIPFTVEMDIASAGKITYKSTAKALKNGEWRVEFSTPIIHPLMEAGQTLALKTNGTRGTVLDTYGRELTAPSLVGTVDENGKGVSGLQARYEKVLAGDATHPRSVVVVDRTSGEAVKALTKSGTKPGEDVRTTIDPRVQEAAAEALQGTDKNVSLVAVDPSTGYILAAANRPGGMNRALEGRYPPGSTFKAVTATALLLKGMKPDDEAACPKFRQVNGQQFENQKQFALPAGSTFRDSFAKSCNTFFVGERARVAGSAIKDAARYYGIGEEWDIGAVSYDGSVPVPESDNELAASTIGQGKVLVSPLVMAAVAATIKEGEFRQPVLVPGHVKKEATAPKLPGAVVEALRDMSRATVTYGAGWALKDIPGSPHAKTGTAEFGAANPPQTHAWMIGYQEDMALAWAVIIEDGGSGGKDAGPVAARFLRSLHS